MANILEDLFKGGAGEDLLKQLQDKLGDAGSLLNQAKEGAVENGGNVLDMLKEKLAGNGDLLEKLKEQVGGADLSEMLQKATSQEGKIGEMAKDLLGKIGLGGK